MRAVRFRKIRVLASIALTPLLAALLPTASVSAATIRAQPVTTIRAQPVTTQRLRNPAAFTIARDGRIFYGEKGSGRIRVINRRTGTISPFFTFPNLYNNRESGFLGITLHPRYPAVPYVYAYGTQLAGGHIWVRLLRITDKNGTGTNPVTLLTASAKDESPMHKGGRMVFGPDGMLYVYVGYSNTPSNSQNLRSVFGKILRMTPDGRLPRGNPFPRSLVWSYGHRASFGMTFDPRSRRLWLTEGGPQCNDELNLVVKGGNYGWGPRADCSAKTPAPPRNTNQDGQNPVQPKLWWPGHPTHTGLVFCTGCRLGPQHEGHLFVGDWSAGNITSMGLSRTRDKIVSQSVVYKPSTRNNVLSMERGPDNALYFSDKRGIYQLVLG